MEQQAHQSTKDFTFATRLATSSVAFATEGFRALVKAVPTQVPKVNANSPISGVVAISRSLEVIGAMVMRRTDPKSPRWIMSYLGVLPDYRRARVASTMLHFWEHQYHPREVVVRCPERCLEVQQFLREQLFLALRLEHHDFGADDGITFSKVF